MKDLRYVAADSVLLGYDAVSLGVLFSTFRKNSLPSSAMIEHSPEQFF
jgi:hypothetical protein